MRPSQLLLSCLLPFVFGLLSTPDRESAQLPLVIWHGLGDTFDNPSLLSLATLANETNPSTFTHIVSLAPTGSLDRRATFLGSLNTQLSEVCTQLASIPELAGGFNAIGFSQGGQFLRGYIERCNSPPVHTLITFGSQHAGIAKFIAECDAGDFVCWTAVRILNSAKWGAWTQRNVVPAQYYRDPEDFENYLENSGWLADVNNEREEKNTTYAENMKGLERFVMFMWEDDTTVVPKESGWFAEKIEEDGVRWLNESESYKGDWVGMRTLDEANKLEFLSLEGGHMQLSDEVMKEVFRVYLGPTGKKGEFKGSNRRENDAYGGEL